MATVVAQCPHCNKTYNAPASLAGKSVKCKQCAEVFTLPSVTADAPPATQGAKASASNARTGAAPTKAANDDSPNRPPNEKLGHPGAGFAKRIERKADTAELSIADEPAQLIMLRPSISFDFPGAAQLDQILPIFLPIAAIAWLVVMAFNSNNTPLPWVCAARAVAYVALCLLVAFPLGYTALKIAARKYRFALPPAAPLRAFAAFSIAFAFSLAFWLSGQSVGMLISGTVLGIILGGGAVWFLFRVQPIETPTTVGAAATAMAASVILSYLILSGVSMIFAYSAKGSANNQLAVSPMGPTIDWDVPVGPKPPEKRPLAKLTTTLPFDLNPTTTAPSTTQGANVTPPPISIDPPVTPPTPPVTPATTRSTDPVVVVPPVTPAVTPPVTPPVTPAAAPHSALVASIDHVADFPAGAQLVFPKATNASAAAIVFDADFETVTFYAGSPLAPRPPGPTQFAAEKGVHQQYFLSPTGDTLVRLASFPQLSVELVNAANPKTVRRVTLNANLGTPELLGFAFNDALVILWNKGSLYGIEVLGTKGAAGQPVATFNIDPPVRTPGNLSISPDGKSLAIAAAANPNAPATPGSAGGIDLWDLLNRRTRPLRTLKVPLTTWIKPTGLAFAPNGAQFAAFFEQDNKSVLFALRAGADVPPVHTHTFSTRMLFPADAAANFTGHTLDYLDNNTLLIFGRTLIDVETGTVLGDLQIDNPKAQHIIDPQTLFLETVDADGKTHLHQVKLNPEALAKKRAEAKGAKPN